MRAPVLLAILVSCCAGYAQESDDNRLVLTLEATRDNPRNSEGSFVELNDGGILFVYTQFYGGNGDFASARLAEVRSADGGLTWSAPKTVVEKENHLNVMSVSLLRLQRGPIAMFYLVKEAPDDCHPVMRTSTDEGKSWSKPVPVIREPGYFVLNNDRVVQLQRRRQAERVLQVRARH